MSILELAITDGFLRASHKLTPAQSRHVEQALLKLRDGNNAVHLHALTPLRFKAFVVNQGALRVICLQEGGSLTLLHVDTHDEAYDWARRHKVVQIGNTVRILPIELDPKTENEPVESKEKGPLAEVPDKVFRYFGIGPLAAGAFRRVPSEDAVLDLAQHLEAPVAEALVSLAIEPDELDRIVRTFEEAKVKPKPKSAIEDVLADPVNAPAIWRLPPGEKPLERALSGELEAWRVFLHPTQSRIVVRDAKGAMKVTGGPGTGKSVVALHRARRLAEHVFKDDARPILLTTFSRVLAEDLGVLLAKLLEDRPEPAARIVTKSITAVIQEVLRGAGRPSELLSGEVLDLCWEKALAHEALDRPAAFYVSERQHVVVREGAWTSAAYLKAERRERHSRLDRAAKKKVWGVIEAFEHAMEERGGGDLASLARDAARVLASGVPQPYAAVVCDEVQDVGPAELRFLAALTSGEAGSTRPNALFLTGDGHQRIYKTGVALSACGIDVRGSSHSLKLNYRTTEGIRSAAVRVIEGQNLDALDESEELASSLDGYRSLRAGPAPEQHVFATRDEEAAWIAAAVGARRGQRVLILARTNKLLDELREKLASRGVEAVKLGEDAVAPSDGVVVLCTLHRAKGLEAPCVIVAATDKVPARYSGGGDDADKAIWKRQEQSLLYVGMSRARDWCAMTRVGAP